MNRNADHTNGKSGRTVAFDDLTGVWNRPGFLAAAAPMLASSQRRGAPIALAHFEVHAADASLPLPQDAAMQRALLAMTAQMRKMFRETDIIGRVGKFRFAVLLTDCDDEALAAVEGVRIVPDSSSPELCLAIGMVRGTSETTLDDLMRAAELRTDDVKREQTGA